VKQGKPIVLRRDGVTHIPSFDEDWKRANHPLAPNDYYTDITSVRRTFREDNTHHMNSRASGANLPTRSSSPAHTTATPSLDSESDVEVIGDIIFTPMGTTILSLKRATRNYSGNKCPAKRQCRGTPPAQRTLHFSPLAESDRPAYVPLPQWSPLANSPSPLLSAGLPDMTRPSTPLSIPSSPPSFFSSGSPYSRSATRSMACSPTSFSVQSPNLTSPSPSLRCSLSPTPQKPWYHGLYCVEFADGLEEMENSRLSQVDAFRSAFPNRLFKRRTFQDNKCQWLNLATPSERSDAIAAGKSEKGLWRKFSKLHPIIKSAKK
jgi:hypothetical protein